MLLGLAGVTGAGKSYYKDKISEVLNFEKIKIITTREPRKGEKNGEDKIFMTPNELSELEKQGEIAYKFDLVGFTYAYKKEDIFSGKNMVVEVHDSCIYDWVKICPDFYSLYLLPSDIEIAKEKLRERNLKPEIEKARLEDLEECYKKIKSDENFRNMFDCIVYNCYNKETDREVIDIIKNNSKFKN